MDDFDDDDEFGTGVGGADMHDETTSATSGAGGDTTGDEDGDGFGERSSREEEIAQEDAWVVISAFFDEKGLVRQQLDSFDHFLEIGLQECVDDAGDISVTSEVQYGPGADSRQTLKRYKIAFGQVGGWLVCGGRCPRPLTTGRTAVPNTPKQVYMSSPNFPEADRETHMLWPADARIRNLTYGCNLYTDVSVKVVELDEKGAETERYREHTVRACVCVATSVDSTHLVLSCVGLW